MQKSRLYLEDILESIKRIDYYTRSTNFDEFSANPMMSDAVIRNLEIIGEAIKKIPSELRQKHLV